MELNLNQNQIVILIIIGVALFFMILGVPVLLGSLNYLGFIDVPFLPSANSSTKVLFIGEPSLGEKVALDNLSSTITYSVRSVDTFSISPEEELYQYDIIIFDQASGGIDKSISVTLGDAIQKYVNKGGNLIIVMNSGIYQSSGLNGYTAADVIGWKATFGKIIPVDCIANKDGVPSCKEGMEESVIGRVWKQDYDHPIMEGIEVAPPQGEAPRSMKVLSVQADEGAKTIAYIKSDATPQTYPAILEKKHLPTGTVIYFNYDPGMTPGIFKNTLYYLK